MNTDQTIAAEVSQYLQTQPLAQADFATQHGPELEASHRDMAQQQPDFEPHARGLGETAAGITGWVWRQVEPVVKQQICSPEHYETLSSITTAQLAARIDVILTPYTVSVTSALPVARQFLTPLLPLLRKLIANIIAHVLEQAGAAGWVTYCGLPARQSSAIVAVAG